MSREIPAVAGLRVLVASPLGGIVQPLLAGALAGGLVVAAGSPAEMVTAVRGRPRFDIVVLDLVWNDPLHEWTFDGLDALDLLRDQDRSTSTLIAIQGSSLEGDHLAEALDTRVHPEVVGWYPKATGIPSLIRAMTAVATGAPDRRRSPHPYGRDPALHEFFGHGAGRTAGRLAAAVASGRTSSYRSLANLAQVPLDTASKLLTYLGPLLVKRGEHPPDEPVTQASVYRWCGEHARYLVSWGRRHGGLGQRAGRWEP